MILGDGWSYRATVPNLGKEIKLGWVDGSRLKSDLYK